MSMAVASSLRSLARRRPRLRLPAAPLVVPGGRAALLSGAAEEAAPLAAAEAAAAPPPTPGRKVLESFWEEFEIGGALHRLRDGKDGVLRQRLRGDLHGRHPRPLNRRRRQVL